MKQQCHMSKSVQTSGRRWSPSRHLQDERDATACLFPSAPLIQMFDCRCSSPENRRSRGSDETSPHVCGSTSQRSDEVDHGSLVRIWKRTDWVVAGAGQQAVGEVCSLVVLPADDAGQRRVEGYGHSADTGVWVEAVTSHTVKVTAGLIGLLVKLKTNKSENKLKFQWLHQKHSQGNWREELESITSEVYCEFKSLSGLNTKSDRISRL